MSQNARTIAKALRLNEDLTEAIALGHDLGHTPFGHAGERALNQISPSGFQHNLQSIRVVEYLEKDGRGLNLTLEVLDGIKNHKTSGKPCTLEGQIVRLSDKIAYINHDIDDAIRGGILKPEDLPEKYTKLLGTTTRSRLDTMVHNVIINSMEQPKIQMSEEIEEAMSGLRKFLFEHVYLNPKAKGEETKAINMISNLFEYYMEHMEALPEEAQSLLQNVGADPMEAPAPDAATKLFSTLSEGFRAEWTAPARALLTLLASCVLCRLVQEFAARELSYAVSVCGALCAAVMLLSPMASLLEQAARVTDAAAVFLLAAVPVYALSLIHI